MNLFDIPLDKFQFFFLIFIRIGGLIFFTPIFSHKSFPIIAKAGFSFFLSMLLFPILWKRIAFAAFSSTADYGCAVAWQLFIGFVIGFTIKLLFEAVRLAGEVVGFQMGLAIVNVIDPQGSSQIPLLSMFKNLFATLLFLAVNAHHWTLGVLAKSFTMLPFNALMGITALSPPKVVNLAIAITGNVFVVGIKLAAPMLAVLVFVNVGLGIVARTVPQINVFIVGFPLQIALGFFILSASLNFFGKVVIGYSGTVHSDVYRLIETMAP